MQGTMNFGRCSASTRRIVNLLTNILQAGTTLDTRD